MANILPTHYTNATFIVSSAKVGELPIDFTSVLGV